VKVGGQSLVEDEGPTDAGDDLPNDDEDESLIDEHADAGTHET